MLVGHTVLGGLKMTMTPKERIALGCVLASPFVALLLALAQNLLHSDNIYLAMLFGFLGQIGGSVWFLFWIVRCPHEKMVYPCG